MLSICVLSNYVLRPPACVLLSLDVCWRLQITASKPTWEVGSSVKLALKPKGRTPKAADASKRSDAVCCTHSSGRVFDCVAVLFRAWLAAAGGVEAGVELTDEVCGFAMAVALGHAFLHWRWVLEGVGRIVGRGCCRAQAHV
jgi:hypothetical protein